MKAKLTCLKTICTVCRQTTYIPVPNYPLPVPLGVATVLAVTSSTALDTIPRESLYVEPMTKKFKTEGPI